MSALPKGFHNTMRDFKFRIFRDRTKEMEYYDWLPNDRGDENWMQYTGLKDRHGKEIYEGDVVKFLSTTGDTCIWEVKYTDQHAAFNAVDPKGMNYYISKHQKLEVIGNIYENPELLNT